MPEEDAVLVANSRGVPIAHDDRSLPARAYANMARRLLGEDVPLIPVLKSGSSFWSRIGLRKHA